jgi:hypothetical protein
MRTYLVFCLLIVGMSACTSQAQTVKSVLISGVITGCSDCLPAVSPGSLLWSTSQNDIYPPTSINWITPKGQLSPVNFTIQSTAIFSPTSTNYMANMFLFDVTQSPMTFVLFAWEILAGNPNTISIENDNDVYKCTGATSVPTCTSPANFLCIQPETGRTVASSVTLC